MTDFCNVYKQYDTKNKCNAPCDTENKLSDCFKHVSLKIHPDKHFGETEKYSEIFKDANNLFNENMKNPLANQQQPQPSKAQPQPSKAHPQQFKAQPQPSKAQPLQSNAQPQQQLKSLLNMFIEQFYSFISLKSGQLSQEQKFSLFICFTLMVTYTDILDDFFKGGKKNNKQKGGNPKIIVYLLALIFVFIFIFDDGDTAHQKLFASNLETILKNNLQIENIQEIQVAATIFMTKTPPPPQKEPAFIEFKGDDDDNHTNPDNLKFTIGDFIPRSKSVYGPPEYLESLKNSILPVANNALGRMLKGTVDLSQLKVVIKELVKSSDKMLGDNVISFNNNEQLIVSEDFFKRFSPSFIKDNKDYISDNNALSCEKNIENCGNFYNKMTSSLFLKRRIETMITKNKDNKDIQITKENIKIEINTAIDEWSFYYKQANVKDILIKMNKFENKLENDKISYDEYKERISIELYKHIERVANIETDVILIKNDLQDQEGSINKMINNIITQRNKNTIKWILEDFVVGPLQEGLREAAYASTNIASTTIFSALNGALHGARLDKRAVSSLFILLGIVGIAANGVYYIIYTVTSAPSRGLFAGQIELTNAKRDADRELINAKRDADRELINAKRDADLAIIEAEKNKKTNGEPQLIENANGQSQLIRAGKKSRKHKVTKKSKKQKKRRNTKKTQKEEIV
jgi:hypothetical protein